MSRLVRREVKGTEYAYLEEDVYYGSKRTVISVYLGPYQEFETYDPSSADAKHKINLKLMMYIHTHEGSKVYKLQHLNLKAVHYLEFARYLRRVFYAITPPDEVKIYSDSFYTQYTQGTTAIEGNTCTLRETDIILNEGISVGGKELREIYEIENYKKLRSLADSYTGDITEEFIKNINETVLDKIDVPKGGYRKFGVAIRGTTFEPPPAALVEEEMARLIEWYSAERSENLHPVELAVIFHQRFEEIHPFAEGNGRTGREIMNFMLKKNGFPAIFFGKPEREQYLRALDAGNIGNHIPLVIFVGWRVFESSKVYEKQVMERLTLLGETIGDTTEKQKYNAQLQSFQSLLEDTLKMAADGVRSIEKNASLDR